jgi:hypothetical protein
MKTAKITLVVLSALLFLGVSSSQAARKDYQVKVRQAIMEDDRLIHRIQHQPFGFRVEIVTDAWGVKPETYKNGAPYVTASRGESYSVRLFNPLPVRVAVNLTVDGLNSITGKPSGIEDGQKWMIEPNSFITIPGWQVNSAESRRFFFTGKGKSYAQWRGDELGKDLSVNCGVIGAAYFWDQEELNRYYDCHPIYRYSPRPWPMGYWRDKSCGMPALSEQRDSNGSAAPSCSQEAPNMDMKMKKMEQEEQAGTGMGERESHPTYQVAFDYNAGMYSPSQAVVIYYGFEEAPVPNPFPSLGYAPEQPLR